MPGIHEDIYFTSIVYKTSNTVYSKILKPTHSSYLSAYEDGTECSETSTYKIQPSENCNDLLRADITCETWKPNSLCLGLGVSVVLPPDSALLGLQVTTKPQESLSINLYKSSRTG